MPSKKPTTRGRVQATRRAMAMLGRVERDLPPTLRDFSRRVRRGLSSLEREIVNARSVARGEATRLLRDASQTLGRYEAYGEKQWRRLTTPARRDVLRILRRLERALAPQPRKRTPKKVAARRPTAPPPSETTPPPSPQPPLASGM